MERRIFHLKTLYDVSQEIIFLRTPQEILQNLLMMIMGTFGTFSGITMLVDISEKCCMEAFAQRGLPECMVEMFAQCAESGCFFEIENVKDIQKLSEKYYTKFDDNSSAVELYVWIPFRVNEKLIGGIGLGEKLSGDPYTDDDRELLTTLASQGAGIIENARLIDQMKREETVRANLARYLSPQVVDQIIHKDMDINLGGDRKEVTVLFSDIRNFTAITETRTPYELVAILNEYFTEMARIIFDNQGSLDKYIGDAFVAVFGSLIEVENSTQHAVEAAIDMMKQMPELNKRWAKEFDGFNMNIGIGINTGDVFLGNIGSPERMEFTVIGDTVNVAARFSDMAEPGEILLPKEAQILLGDSVEVEQLPDIEIKGKSGEMEVYRIKGA